MMAQPGPRGSIAQSQPAGGDFSRQRCENDNFTLYGSKFTKFQPAAPAPISESQTGVAGLRVAGWLTETLVSTHLDDLQQQIPRLCISAHRVHQVGLPQLLADFLWQRPATGVMRFRHLACAYIGIIYNGRRYRVRARQTAL
jgi:hypothetical protein